MAGAKVREFKALFPASATPYKLSIRKPPVTAKFTNKWGTSTLKDLASLAGLFGVRLHLKEVTEGCIAVTWLCSATDVTILKEAITQAADTLRHKGVLQVFVGEELVYQSGILLHGNACNGFAKSVIS